MEQLGLLAPNYSCWPVELGLPAGFLNHFNPTFIFSPVPFDNYNFPDTNATTEYDAALQHPDFTCNLSDFGGSHNFILTPATASEMNSFRKRRHLTRCHSLR
jgi:hypothetical protein